MSLHELVGNVQSDFADLDGRPGIPPGPRAPEPPWLLESVDGIPVERDEEPLLDIESLGQVLPDSVLGSPQGADALAYYRPFHFHWHWGIFIRVAGIGALARGLKGGPLDQRDGMHFSLAWRVLLEHERFHFITEVSGSRAEMVSRTRIYIPFFSKREPAELEEALANARACRGVHNVPEVLKDWMRRQGPGYRDFEAYLTGSAFQSGTKRLLGTMLDHLHVGYSNAPLGPLEFLTNNASKMRVPVYLVPERWPTVGLGRPFPKEYGLQVVVHTHDHPPPHIHIRVIQEGFETRYSWPALTPLERDTPLKPKWRKSLAAYVKRHGTAIGAKMASVYGQPAVQTT